MKVRVAVQGRPDQAALELAYRRGYFERVGLDVEEVQIDSGSQMVPQLATNNLQKEGVPAANVDVVALPIPDMLAALANKTIAAATLTEPLVTDSVQKGIASILYTAGTLRPGTYLSLLQYSPQFAHDPSDVGIRFMEGYLRGVRDYYDAFQLKQNQGDAIQQLTKYLSVKDPKVWETFGPLYIDLNGYVDAKQLQAAANFFASQGELQGAVPDMAQSVEPRFAEAAVKALGARQAQLER